MNKRKNLLFHLSQSICCSYIFCVACLLQILKVLSETAVAVRTKAMKCLTAVVEADPGILARVSLSLLFYDCNYHLYLVLVFG